jgi:porin
MVEDATVPNTSLGGGLLLEPCERLTGSLLVFGTAEMAGEDPFDGWHGTTFSTEWTIGHTLFEREGAQTLGFLYGIDAERADIAADPRIVIASAIIGLPTPTTRADSWAFYYNAHQFLIGDGDRGLGAFVRFGISDGNPNVVHWTVAGGVGGTGLLPSRRADRWGLGVFYVKMSDEDLLRRRGVDHEVGGELFYDFAVTPWLQWTADAQLIDSALPASDTAIVLAVRTRVEF